MKLLITLLCLTTILSCTNNSAQIKTYEDSGNYFSQKLATLTDSGFSNNDSIKMHQKTRIFIYETMRQHYIDLANELKK